jgi:hypothetical protein
MPEYASLHRSAHQINEHSAGKFFSRALVNLDMDQSCPRQQAQEVPPELQLQLLPSRWAELDGVEDWKSFGIVARSRGKEVCVLLCKDTPSPSRGVCPTCRCIAPEQTLVCVRITRTPMLKRMCVLQTTDGIPICPQHHER